MIPRGTFVFPKTDRDFMQQLEIRGNNGGVETVETVYALTGSTYFVPEELFAFDDPGLYREAEPTSVTIDDRAAAETIHQFYEDRSGPRMIVRVHTYPGGVTQPSSQDRSVASNRRPLLDQYFDDYELFLGIHGLGEECDPDPEWMRVPRQTDENEISWWGENRKHTLAVYDDGYEPRPMMVTSAAELRQQRQQRQAGRQARTRPETEPEPEPGGEIWDA